MTLKDLDFKLVYFDEKACYWRYNNEDHNHQIVISYDGEDWYICSKAISEDLDWYGFTYHEAMGMTLIETQACLNTIEELKKSIR